MTAIFCHPQHINYIRTEKNSPRTKMGEVENAEWLQHCVIVNVTFSVSVMRMRNIVSRAGIKPTSLALWVSVLTITPCRFP